MHLSYSFETIKMLLVGFLKKIVKNMHLKLENFCQDLNSFKKKFYTLY